MSFDKVTVSEVFSESDIELPLGSMPGSSPVTPAPAAAPDPKPLTEAIPASPPTAPSPPPAAGSAGK
jgi:hypothetical protein